MPGSTSLEEKVQGPHGTLILLHLHVCIGSYTVAPCVCPGYIQSHVRNDIRALCQNELANQKKGAKHSHVGQKGDFVSARRG